MRGRPNRLIGSLQVLAHVGYESLEQVSDAPVGEDVAVLDKEWITTLLDDEDPEMPPPP